MVQSVSREERNRMTAGPIAKKMISFALPLMLGNLFQQLYNTADALIVGKYLGEQALAAVTSVGSLVFMLVGFFGGMFAGAGVVIARYFGARDTERMRAAIHTDLTFALLAAMLITLIGTTCTPAILRWMGTPEGPVMDMSCKYIRIYLAGSIGLVFYNCCMGMMQAVGDSRHPLMYLVIASCTNVVLDILLLTVFRMGVEGAALATIFSQLLSVTLCLWRLTHVKESYRVSFRELGINGPMMKQIVSNGLPGGLQNSVIAIANVVVQANINHFGELAMAGCGAYSKIEGFAFLPVTAFTSAITTFVSQNLGAGEKKRAIRGSRFGIICGVLLAEFIGVTFYILAPALIGCFTDNPEAIAFGVKKARICSLFYCLLSGSHCLSAVLRGAGKAVIPMATMLTVWCVIRVAFLEIMVPIYEDIAVVNWVYPLTWCISAVFLAVYYLKADWPNSYALKSK